METASRWVKALIALSSVSAVLVLIGLSGAGVVARLAVYAFLLGTFASALATVLSIRARCSPQLKWISGTVLAFYVLVAGVAMFVVFVMRPPFG